MPTTPDAGPRSGPASPTTPANPAARIDAELFLDCVHCGLCTAACPTYLATGDENDSPRGRIYLMRGAAEGRWGWDGAVREHVERCLDCRACETACPSGVQYGRLVEPFRVGLAEADRATGKTPSWFERFVLFGLFPNRRRLGAAVALGRFAQRTGLHGLAERLGLFRLAPGPLGRLGGMLPAGLKAAPPLPSVLPAVGTRRARVALFTGCVADAMFRGVHWATARVLAANGCEVVIPPEQGCCGAIHYHAGAEHPARDLADQNLAALPLGDVDAVIVNVAGCGAMLKDYGHLFGAERYADFAAKVRDVTEFLDDLGLKPPTGEIRRQVVYHDACHLRHAQGVADAPRRLLAAVPGLQVAPLIESEVCCGAAGTYNLVQPELADQLGARKLDHILATGASAVLAANAGCILQIAREARTRGVRLAVEHPIEVLDRSYRGEQPDW